MPLPTALPYGIRDIKIAPYTDAAATTLAATSIDLPNARTGVEYARLRFDRVNAIEVPKEIADWLIDNDAFAVAD